jgi:multidrug efflux system membrane fusion protein
VDGIAGFYNVNQGNEVFSANQTVLTTIMQVTPIYLDFTVTGAQLPDVQERYNAAGGNLTMKAAYLNRTDPWREATLKYLGNAVDQTTGTVMARGIYPNTDRHFWPGQAIRTQLILETLQNALLVPTASISLGQSGYYVYVMNPADDTVALRAVTPGEHAGDNTIITSGLQVGEQVVVTGQYMLKPGDTVKVVTPLTGETEAQGVTTTTAPDSANITPADSNTTAVSITN